MIFFESWNEIYRVVITAVLTYLLCIGLISFFGKRSSAKMNNFDWIVTVAMGSILGSSVLLKKVVVLEVLSGLLILLTLQFLFNKMSVNFAVFRNSMKRSPTLLFFSGEYIEKALQRERVTKDEVRTGIRCIGLIDEKDVSAVILEPNGELSVIPAPPHRSDNRSNDAILTSVEQEC